MSELLRAGAQVNVNKSCGRTPLDSVFTLIHYSCCNWLSFTDISICKDFLRLITDVICLLIEYEAVPANTGFYGHVVILCEVAELVYEGPTNEHIAGFIEARNDVIDILTNMCRCILLSGGPFICLTDGLFPQENPHFSTNNVIVACINRFINALVKIIGQAPPCEHSVRLVRVMLCVLTANGLNQLKSLLFSHHHFLLHHATVSHKYGAHVLNTLQWIQGQQPPRSLQHLARLAILRTMSHRSLRSAASLGLPAILQRYVLLDES